jgi:hypothetical protein
VKGKLAGGGEGEAGGRGIGDVEPRAHGRDERSRGASREGRRQGSRAQDLAVVSAVRG